MVYHEHAFLDSQALMEENFQLDHFRDDNEAPGSLHMVLDREMSLYLLLLSKAYGTDNVSHCIFVLEMVCARNAMLFVKFSKIRAF